MSPQRRASAFARAKTLVLKVGSAVLTTPSGHIDHDVMRSICGEIVDLMRSGRKVILVTSGAVAAGRDALGHHSRPATIAVKQALAAVGQSRIMRLYSDIFAEHGIIVGQMLLSRGDIEDRRRYVNAHYTLKELLHRGCLPIINENDTVTIDELRFGDNDGLAALVAVKMGAEALLLLSDVDGLYDSNPKQNPDARFLDLVEKITPSLVEELCPTTPGSSVGSGGMYSKLLAARTATSSNVSVVITHGKKPGRVAAVMSGNFRGTFFPPVPSRHKGRRKWILARKSSSVRRIVIDDGARNALVTHKKSLLPAGVKALAGEFAHGDLVEVADAAGTVLAQGIVNYSSAELEQIRGRHTGDIEKILGSKPYDEVIHRDNLVMRE